MRRAAKRGSHILTYPGASDRGATMTEPDLCVSYSRERILFLGESLVGQKFVGKTLEIHACRMCIYISHCFIYCYFFFFHLVLFRQIITDGTKKTSRTAATPCGRSWVFYIMHFFSELFSFHEFSGRKNLASLIDAREQRS